MFDAKQAVKVIEELRTAVESAAKIPALNAVVREMMEAALQDRNGAAPERKERKKYKLSARARRNMALAQQKRWTEKKKNEKEKAKSQSAR